MWMGRENVRTCGGDMYEERGREGKGKGIRDTEQGWKRWIKRLQRLREEGKGGREKKTENRRTMDEYKMKREKE